MLQALLNHGITQIISTRYGIMPSNNKKHNYFSPEGHNGHNFFPSGGKRIMPSSN